MVELALSITFIFFLASAAIDLALAFKFYQALEGAATEAAAFLGENAKDSCTGGCNQIAVANNNAINRFRLSAGEDDGASKPVGSLRDLNANGLDDVAGDLCNAACFQTNTAAPMIQILEVNETVLAPGANMRTVTASPGCATRPVIDTSVGSFPHCYILVRTQGYYKPFFGLAPAIGHSKVVINAYAVAPISR